MDVDRQAIFRARIKDLRLKRGFDRRRLGKLIGVGEATIRHWEKGRNLPTRDNETRLAGALGIPVETLYSGTKPSFVRAIDTETEMPELLLQALSETKKFVLATRLCMDYVQPSHVQAGFREALSKRLLSGSVRVQVIDIFFNMKRIGEMIRNFQMYEGCPYYVKFYPASDTVVPSVNLWSFDNRQFFVGGYHRNIPPLERVVNRRNQ